MKAVNWNTQEDMTNMFWRQNISQMWVETEFKVSKDIASWKTLTDSEKNTFKKALAGLTGLDTHQADDGMPLIMLHTTDLRKKAVYSFMAMMEQIHAKSYSHIFTTLLPSSETNYLLDTWVIEEPHLKYKSDNSLRRLCASKPVNTPCIDSSKSILRIISPDVVIFPCPARYNGNKALSNLGFEPYFEEREFNPIIENALDTSTKNHDFFSVKGDGYTLALNVEPLRDEDFVFDN